MQTLIQSRPAKAALAGIGVFALALSATQAFAAIGSNVYIDPQETFVLGGAQKGDFDVRGQNRGDVAVEVYVRAANGEDILVTTIQPGERFNADFVEGEGALLKNTSDTARAHVKVRITGTTRGLGMRYEGW